MMTEGASPPSWERQVIEKLAFAALQEQRRTRRWGIFFKALTLLYLFLLLAIVLGWIGQRGHSASGKHTALVDLRGVIAEGSSASADYIISGLQDAFESKGTQGVVLRINSPGGSPVQANQINQEIRRLRGKHKDVPIYAVVEDLCASGGYYVAVAADKIFVDKSSLVGSIGVLMDGFGFTGTMDKFGVDRRLLTAGENKGFLDPFSPRNPVHEDYAKTMLGEIHQQFINVVREGRGKRLKDAPEIFSGIVWTGEKSVALGLADAYGGLDYVAREIIKAEDIVDFTPQENIAERLIKRLGASFGQAVARTLASQGPNLR